MTPHAFIAAHIVDVAPSAAADPKAWRQYKASLAVYLLDAETLGVDALARAMGWCPACGSEGSTLVGDVDVKCRECVPVQDPMDAYKEEVEK